jgi:hypothetical protein
LVTICQLSLQAFLLLSNYCLWDQATSHDLDTLDFENADESVLEIDSAAFDPCENYPGENNCH